MFPLMVKTLDAWKSYYWYWADDRDADSALVRRYIFRVYFDDKANEYNDFKMASIAGAPPASLRGDEAARMGRRRRR